MLFRSSRDELAALRQQAMGFLEGFDALVVPTAPEHPTLAAVATDPLGTNARLGTYTNFVNLFDMAGVAVPAGRADGGLFGVSILVRGFADQVAIDLAARLLAAQAGTPVPALAGPAAQLTCTNPDGSAYPSTGVSLVVFGAHLTGEPLNSDLVDLGARFVGSVRTAPHYRMHALATEPPKPLVSTVAAGTGVALTGEEWLLTPHALGQLLLTVPQPLALGAITLEDGRRVTGFTGSLAAVPGAVPEDVSHLGSWRAYRAAHV